MKTLNIRESSAQQYKNLQDLGAVLIVDPTFIEKASLIAENASNFYFEHPSMPNTTVMVFGRNEAYAVAISSIILPNPSRFFALSILYPRQKSANSPVTFFIPFRRK